jgi:hypothetical protein
MNEHPAEASILAEPLPSAPHPQDVCISVWRWIVEGWRCAFFLRPSIGQAHPTPFQFAALLLAYSAMNIGLERLLVEGPAEFYASIWRFRWWSLSFLLWMGWAALYLDAKRNARNIPNTQPELSGLTSWFILTCGASAPAVFVSHILYALDREWLSMSNIPHWFAFRFSVLSNVQWLYLALLGALWLWVFAASFRLAFRYIVSWKIFFLYAIASALFLLLFSPEKFEMPLWGSKNEPGREYSHLHLTQALFEKQQTLWEEKTRGILPDRKKTLDVYALVFAPDGSEDVFLRESAMVADVLRRRFNADGRLLHLLNHPRTGERLPWATQENLRRGIDALAKRMDRENDVLIVYMTSHGTKSGELYAANWPLGVPSVNAAMLREMLDASGVRNRILFISACYAGKWIPALSNESTLIMTASDSESTSYGCGNISELTFFGRALFHEQFRQTHSFKAAFAQARIDIRRRELEAGKKDYSNPQILIGQKIVPVLDALEKRLENLDKIRNR